MLGTQQGWKVGWAQREANSPAHAMVKEGVTNDLYKAWLHVPPDFIMHVVAYEIRGPNE